MPHKPELLSLDHAELRIARSDDGQRTLSGLIPYNSRSVDLGGFKEEIAPGAFQSALQPESDVLALRDHDSKALLGRTKSGTLRLMDSPEGLRYVINLPNTTHGNDLAESVSRGDLDATSFGFAVNEDAWVANATEVVRTLRSVSLLEVSPCSFPAYPDSSIALRSAPREIQERIKPVPADKRDADLLTDCTCECDACNAGNCLGCSDPDCSCEGCTCPSAMNDDRDGDEDRTRTLMHMALSLRHRR